jgi:hypothetical protein
LTLQTGGRDNVRFLNMSDVKRLVLFLKNYPWGVLVIAYGVLETILKVSSNATASAKFGLHALIRRI